MKKLLLNYKTLNFAMLLFLLGANSMTVNIQEATNINISVQFYPYIRIIIFLA